MAITFPTSPSDGDTLTAGELGELNMVDALQGWVGAMRTVMVALVTAQDATYADDAHWPAPPAGSDAFVNQF
jgi:hypothetical protein